MTREEAFFNALRDVFIGAKVEGESGYVNLMRIKSRYYERGVFPHLQKDIAEAVAPFPEFREELFDRLYTFFHRYFSESGSIYFRYTPLHERIYEQVYTDDRDVVLFWKTHMLYYVKTDRVFQSLKVDLDGLNFYFDVSKLEHKRANEKRELVYQFSERRAQDGALVFEVAYSERGRKTKVDEIQRALSQIGVTLDEETLERAFRVFERQSEVDYFINKNARAFLCEQFDLWLYQYVFKGETEWTERRIKQLQVLKAIAYKIVDFIAQFEDELVKIWNKPKFVLDSHYVITLDRIAAAEGGTALLERLLAHPGMPQQVQEWRDLGMVGEAFSPEQVWGQDLLGRSLHPRWQYLPLDTRYFADLELAILRLFDHLDQALDGWLIKSENYQALNTLRIKFQQQVRCIYIDPPYNSDYSEIDYENRFKHASWLALMENRLRIASDTLTSKGLLICAIDKNEQERLGLQLEQLFPGNTVTFVAVVHNPRGIQGEAFSYCHEFAYFVYSGADSISPKVVPQQEWEYQNLRNWGGESRREDAKSCFYPLYVRNGRVVRIGEVPSDAFHPKSRTKVMENGEIEVWPIDRSGVERKWRYQRKSLEKVLHAVRVVEIRGDIEIELARVRVPYKTVWLDSKYDANTYGTRLLGELGLRNFSFPKSIYTVQECISTAVQDDKAALIFDFFAGSGTTAHAVINLNREDGGRRKYILVEMADYFDTVLLPRVKKVVFSEKWKDGKAENGEGISHFLKYFRLEQYEDTLRRVRYQDADLFDDPHQDPYSSYVFLRDTKLLDNAETGQPVVELDVDADKVRVNLERLYNGIDLAETLSCVTGKRIRRIHPNVEDPSRPGEVEFEGGERVSLVDPPWELIRSLVWW